MLLGVEHLQAGYGRQQVLNDISFTAATGTFTALLGMNGSGKSTVLRVLASLLQKQGGRITIDGRDLDHIPRPERVELIGFMPQETEPVNLTCYEAIVTGLRAGCAWKHRADEARCIEQYLKRFGLHDIALKSTVELSGGEFQRVLIAKTLAQEPSILLLDEPTSHLDIAHQLDVLSILKDITHKRNLITLLVTHNINNAFRFCDRFVVLRNGCLEAAGGSEIITRSMLRNAFSLDAAIETLHNREIVIPFQRFSAKEPGHGE